MYDTTVLRPPGARDSSAITQREPGPEEPGPEEPRTDRMTSASGAVPGAGQR